MKYLLDEKNNRETIYAMNPDCEICLSIARADTDYEENNLPLDCCAECPLYYDGCFNHHEIYSGKIGSSFLEFMYFHDSSDQYFRSEANTNDPIIKLKKICGIY